MRDFEKVITLLKEYKEEHGDCLVTQAYITEDGIHLGQIVRRIRKGERKTTPEEKAILDNLGFVWKVNKSPVSFNEVVILLKEYKEEYGNCLAPQMYTTEDGIRLGNIVKNIREGIRKTTPEEKEILDSLGFVWTIKISFNEVVILLKEYKKEHGNCLVPQSYVTECGVHLGKIVNSLRSGNRKTTPEEKEILDSLGFVWKAKRGRRS